MAQLLHGSATTTARTRGEIQASGEPAAALARRYGVNRKTVLKWRRRETVADAPMGPRERRSTVLSEVEEAAVVAFRVQTHLALDDVVAALRPSIPGLTVGITAHDLPWLEGREQELARVLVDRGLFCSRSGFAQGGRYLVERLVLAAAKAPKASAYAGHDNRGRWDSLTRPGFVFPARSNTLWHGILERHSKYDDLSVAAPGDFKLRWYETDASRLPGTALSSHLPGVEQLATPETQAEVLNELARWASYERPGPRMLTACCFLVAMVLTALWLGAVALTWVTQRVAHPG